MLIRLVDLYEAEVEHGFKQETDNASQLFEHGRYQAAKDMYRAMQHRAEGMIARGEAIERPALKRWAQRV
jgi:hypothetical protein